MARKLRLECEQRTRAGGVLKDLRTGCQAWFNRGEGVTLELALFANGRMLTAEEITSIKVRWLNGSTLLSETVVLNAALSDSITAAQWRQGTASLSTVNFSSDATGDLPAGMLTLEISAITTGGTAIYASGTVESVTLTGLSPGEPPEPGPPASYTKEEADAIASGITLSNLAITGGTFTPHVYGAVGDGTTDDTTALQAAINAASAVCGRVVLQNKRYRITAPLVMASALSFAGVGCSAIGGDRSIHGSDVFPMESPYLRGSVIEQTTAGANAINITVIGEAVHLSNFGIKFADTIKFANTGHGIYCHPGAFTFDPTAPQYSEPNGDEPHTNIGMQFSHWDNIRVYGHDGDHYAFNLTNTQLNTFLNPQSYGGGGFLFFVDTPTGYYGNSTLVNPYVCLSEGGTADGYRFDNTWAGHGVIYMVMIRPQTFAYSERVGMVTPMNFTQYLSWFSNDSWYLSIVGGNAEGSGHAGIRMPQYKRGYSADMELVLDTSKDIHMHLGDPTDFNSILFHEDNGTTQTPHAFLHRMGLNYGSTADDIIRRGALEVGTIYGSFDIWSGSARRARFGEDGGFRIGNLLTAATLTDGTYTPAMAVASPTDGSKWLGLGYKGTTAFLQSAHHLTGYTELALNPQGGVTSTGDNVRLDLATTSSLRVLSFAEAGTLSGYIQRIGSAFATTRRRRAVEIGTLDAGAVRFSTNQVERGGFESDGKFVLEATACPTYTNDAAADADAALPSGGLYRTTAGARTVYRKP